MPLIPLSSKLRTFKLFTTNYDASYCNLIDSLVYYRLTKGPKALLLFLSEFETNRIPSYQE